MGPTAAGKTALAIEIAYRHGWEIISCDSRQIYRGMRIGTAQPGPEACARVKHWLIGIRDPDEFYSAYDFARDAGAVIRERSRCGITTLLCGGTGLYFECLRKGIGPQIATDPLLRSQLTLRVNREGSEALHRELKKCDPQTARTVHPNDAQRIVRALAVYLQTGVPLSMLKRRTRSPLDLAFTVAVMVPRLPVLYRRIDKRTHEMVSAGLYEEFIELRRMGYDRRSAGMQGIGYRELFDVEGDRRSLDEAVELIKKNTRNYAKRQCAWFRSHNRAEMVGTDGSTDRELRDEVELIFFAEPLVFKKK